MYQFRCRNLDQTVYPLTDILDDLNEQLDHLCALKFKDDELQYLRSFRFIKSDFVDYLELFQLKRRFIRASIDAKGRLDISVEGPMIQAMMFEILYWRLSMNCISGVFALRLCLKRVNDACKPNLNYSSSMKRSTQTTNRHF